jgi:hypothetical protein
VRRRLIRAIGFLLAAGWAGQAFAHLTPNSEISLDIGRTVVAAEVVVPMGEIGYALGRPLPIAPGPDRQATLALLRRELLAHLAVTAPDGRPWSLEVRDLAIADDGASPDFRAHLLMRPPKGASLRKFDLSYALIIDRVPNHFVLVLQHTDFDGGRLSTRSRMIGGLQQGVRTVRVDPGPGNAWRGFVAAVGLGMRHIAEGHDHLLFLLTLLLPAPLLAQAGRWTGYGGLRHTMRRLLGVVSAFTVGHSLTLLGGAFLGWQLRTQPVEVMIAVSILVSSVHAWRPLFAGREPWVAGGFGLIHGLAFATLIGHFGLEPLQKAQSILGFNVGIELVQLLVVATVMPALILLARTRTYPTLRVTGAIFTGAAAIAWIVERVGGATNIVGRVIDGGLAYSPWLVALLTLGALAATWAERRRRAVEQAS